MSSRRTLRIAEAIREVVSSAILFETSDPRVRGVTVLSAEVSPDLRHAKIFVSVMGDERQKKLAMHGLRSAKGFLQSKIAARLQTRVTPVVEFQLDEGIGRSVALSRLIDETLEADRRATAEHNSTDSDQDSDDEDDDVLDDEDGDEADPDDGPSGPEVSRGEDPDGGRGSLPTDGPSPRS